MGSYLIYLVSERSYELDVNWLVYITKYILDNGFQFTYLSMKMLSIDCCAIIHFTRFLTHHCNEKIYKCFYETFVLNIDGLEIFLKICITCDCHLLVRSKSLSRRNTNCLDYHRKQSSQIILSHMKFNELSINLAHTAFL